MISQLSPKYILVIIILIDVIVYFIKSFLLILLLDLKLLNLNLSLCKQESLQVLQPAKWPLAVCL